MRVESLRKVSNTLLNTMKAVTAIGTVGITVAAVVGIANILVMLGQEYPKMLQQAGSMDALARNLVYRFLLAYLVTGAISSVFILGIRKKMGFKEMVFITMMPIIFFFLLAGGVGFMALAHLWNIGWVLNIVSAIFIFGWVVTAALAVKTDLKDTDSEHERQGVAA